jgi:hypothetical protein
MICRQLVSAINDVVSDAAVKIIALQALQAVFEADLARLHAHADRRVLIGKVPVAAAAGVMNAQGTGFSGAGKLAPRTVAPECESTLDKSGSDISVSLAPLRLEVDSAIPVQMQPFQQLDDALCAAGYASRRIEIVDTEQPPSAALSGMQVTGNGGCDGACVQRPCR